MEHVESYFPVVTAAIEADRGENRLVVVSSWIGYGYPIFVGELYIRAAIELVPLPSSRAHENELSS